ncbi:UDP-3-O-acyl-N-acetylglucosamine deacetylase [uncultured Lamprocystis sp.]|uniref:UDP-3-O-acyl-N-acetylglucosamine deacetylase n=1 Tax=uncultured Lamprocystis sp. TaxID=543132 RepID=UPI0025CC8478|nr:UDP-3-O-acyl-N-acetylglucosamine deacetylase [uncultured Lamprocystis sp.]
MTRSPVSQTTIATPVTLAGAGLHTGRRARVTLRPARAGSGVRFRRTDGRGGAMEVAALWSNRVPAVLCTALRCPDGSLLRTVEHLLASLSAFGLDNVLVDIEGEELPIFDGSALPWCRALEAAGRVALAVPRQAIRVLEPVEFVAERRCLRIAPASHFSIAVTMDLRDFGALHWDGAPDAEIFTTELAPARSFGRPQWALPAMLFGLLRRQPILRGARPNNVALLWGNRILGGARVPQEPVRHRVLDLLGDLALAGAPIIGRVTALRPGHDFNHALVERLMSRPHAFERITLNFDGVAGFHAGAAGPGGVRP